MELRRLSCTFKMYHNSFYMVIVKALFSCDQSQQVVMLWGEGGLCFSTVKLKCQMGKTLLTDLSEIL